VLNDALEPWEIIFYPFVAVVIVLWNNWPPMFYWSQLLRLEVLLWIVLGVFEVFHWRRRIPLLSRAILVGLPMSLTATLVMPGSSRLFYWIAIGLSLYLGLLGFLFNRFDRWWANRKRH
jgi:hypothetical protein